MASTSKARQASSQPYIPGEVLNMLDSAGVEGKEAGNGAFPSGDKKLFKGLPSICEGARPKDISMKVLLEAVLRGRYRDDVCIIAVRIGGGNGPIGGSQ